MMLSLTAPTGSDLRASASDDARHPTSFWALTVGSIGVVYGDIGTSPLYAFREAIVAATAGTAENPKTVIIGRGAFHPELFASAARAHGGNVSLYNGIELLAQIGDPSMKLRFWRAG